MAIKETQLNIKISDGDKIILENAAKLNNEYLSAFIRRAGLKKAKQILKENSEVPAQ